MSNIENEEAIDITALVAGLQLNEKTNISESLFELIKRLILCKQLPQGYRFPNENSFCEMLKISRSSLRETYVKLELLGLVTRSRAGTHVSDMKNIESASLLNTALQRSELKEILEFRSILEVEICALAAERISDQELYLLEDLLEHMIESQDNIVALTHYDIQFHYVIAEASKNKLLQQSLNMVYEKYSKLVFQAFKFGAEPRISAVVYHRMILRALSQHSPQLAREIMRDHMLDVRHSNPEK